MLNLRHAAALALVGWYLMVPPYNGVTLNPDAPISKWTVYSGTDGAHECEELKIDQWKRVKNGSSPDDILLRKQLAMSQCISSDDPRLAK